VISCQSFFSRRLIEDFLSLFTYNSRPFLLPSCHAWRAPKFPTIRGGCRFLFSTVRPSLLGKCSPLFCGLDRSSSFFYLSWCLIACISPLSGSGRPLSLCFFSDEVSFLLSSFRRSTCPLSHCDFFSRQEFSPGFIFLFTNMVGFLLLSLFYGRPRAHGYGFPLILCSLAFDYLPKFSLRPYHDH